MVTHLCNLLLLKVNHPDLPLPPSLQKKGGGGLSDMRDEFLGVRETFIYFFYYFLFIVFIIGCFVGEVLVFTPESGRYVKKK